jgi:hypothetical protein
MVKQTKLNVSSEKKPEKDIEKMIEKKPSKYTSRQRISMKLAKSKVFGWKAKSFLK